MVAFPFPCNRFSCALHGPNLGIMFCLFLFCVLCCIALIWASCLFCFFFFFFFLRWGSIPRRRWHLVTLDLGEPNPKSNPIALSAMGWIRSVDWQALHDPHGSLAVHLKYKKKLT